jgi:uroporphyrin-III C-methyltransferase/precorrin-2 dehydrogenase/sirohydrochlorin ferrochelatase
VQSSGLSFAARRRFWQLFTGFAVAHPDRRPAQPDFESLLHQSKSAMPAEPGTITLVGAGPGDPELLTLRAVRALQSADVILIDDLVAPELLDFARREATKMLIGSTGHFAPGRPDDISTTISTLAQSGKRVVWLKHGDLTTFGRPGREIAACRAAGINIEVVPGIAAAADTGGSILLKRFLTLAANRRQRNQQAERERGDQQAEADRPL